MREIKFRAWDKYRKVMLYDNDSCGYVEEDKHEVDVINSILSEGYDEDLVFMQYAGIEDIDGYGIFEGDIVKVWVTKTIYFVAKVEFLKGAFGIGLIPRGYGYRDEFSSFYNNPGAQYEIIGNIYENPELLEAE